MLKTSIKQKIKNSLPKPIFAFLVSLKNLSIKKIPHSEVYFSHIVGKKGIEIGGPSTLFKTALPLYKKIQSLDGVNFSNTTVWEGEVQSGLNYNFIGNKKGVQFISDATDLSQIKNSTYDFLIPFLIKNRINYPFPACNTTHAFWV